MAIISGEGLEPFERPLYISRNSRVLAFRALSEKTILSE